MRPDIETDIPEEFLKRMKESLGEEYPDFLESLNKPEQKALRINPLSGFSGFDESIAKRWRLEPVSWEKNGFYYGEDIEGITPGKHCLHEAGAWYIQDASAMYPVSMLYPQKHERILDLCAAPGGKSTQIAACMDNTGLLVCNEIIPSRAAVLSRNIERMGVINALVTNMEPAGISMLFPAFFDRILVDAPCSGEGMLRRGEAARVNWSPENVAMCAKRQRDILNEAAKCLKPGGCLLYSTCTFSKEEDEETIEAFLKEHPDYFHEESKKLYPHKIRGEGQYAALLKRRGDNGNCTPDQKKRPVKSGRDIKPVTDFLGDFLESKAQLKFPEERIISFKESFYLLPEGVSGLNGIKTVRPGLCLGEMKKNRFEPSHSLAAALRPEDVKACLNIDSESSDAYGYLSGMPVSLNDEKAKNIKDGWCMVAFDGVSAGLGKKTGNIIKNHYPKGLRRSV